MIVTRIDRQLAEWLTWYEKLITIQSGMPSDYSFDRIRSYQPSSCIVPLVDIPRRLVVIDRAMREIDSRLWAIIWIRHGERGTEDEKCEAFGFSKSWYRRMVGLSHKYIDQMGG